MLFDRACVYVLDISMFILSSRNKYFLTGVMTGY
jgi:hypothetical protein